MLQSDDRGVPTGPILRMFGHLALLESEENTRLLLLQEYTATVSTIFENFDVKLVILLALAFKFLYSY